jgi:hypothetical protein
MKLCMRTFLTIMVVTLCATTAVFARTHHRTRTVSAAATKTGATSPVERTAILQTSLSIAGLKILQGSLKPAGSCLRVFS